MHDGVFSAGESQYIALLEQILADGEVTSDEAVELEACAKQEKLTAADRHRLSLEYLKQLALALLCDGSPADERDQKLVRDAELLGLPPDAVPQAVAEVQHDADQLAILLLNSLPEETVERSSWASLPGRVRSSLAPGAWLSTVKAGLTVVSTISLTLKTPNEIDCRQCSARTKHVLHTEGSFPIQSWLKLCWEARSLSVPGFAWNAATLVLADRQLLTATGKSLLPLFRCTVCGSTCDHWSSACVLISTTQKAVSQGKRAQDT